MQREERNRFLLYKRPIDEAIKLKRQEKQAINESKNLSKLLDDHVGQFTNYLLNNKQEEFKKLFDEQWGKINSIEQRDQAKELIECANQFQEQIKVEFNKK